MKKDVLYKIKSAILGHAIADALGVPVEFTDRSNLDETPVVDMEGFGTYPFPAGCWSDDTSMTLAALDSLSKGYVDWNDIMLNFGKWYYDDEYTPTGEMFDVGNTCSLAIDNYFKGNKSFLECGLRDERSNGNGSLMRIIPFVLFSEFCGYEGDLCELIHTASGLTHSHERSEIGCGIYSFIIKELLRDPSKESIKIGLNKARAFYKDYSEFLHYRRIFELGFEKTGRDSIKSSGYIVDTLEAALWCLLTTENYKDCVLKSVNLGDDTDTIAAVAGGLAGILYGYDKIPKKWKETLLRKDYIENMCELAYVSWRKGV